jgi:hypothetical protein
MVVCDFCGTPAQANSPDAANGDDDSSRRSDDVPFTWITSVENGKRRVHCERCSRDHLRSIESKLDSEWW